jgi:hypothetical protein
MCAKKNMTRGLNLSSHSAQIYLASTHERPSEKGEESVGIKKLLGDSLSLSLSSSFAR